MSGRNMVSNSNWKSNLLLLIPGTLWGSAFWITEVALTTIPPFTLTTVRNLIAAIAMALLLILQGGKLSRILQLWRPLLIIGLFNNALPFSLTTWSQVYLDSGLASILISTMPLFSIILAHLFIAGERLTGPKIGGVLMGSVGILILVGPSVLQNIGLHGWAQLAVIGAASIYAIGGILVKRLMQRSEIAYGRVLSTGEIVTGQFIASTFILIPLSFLIEQPWTIRPSSNSIIALLVLALPITILAMQVYYHLIQTSGPGFASITVYLIPINGVFWGSFLLHEPFTWQAVVALFLILGGIGIVNGVFKAKSKTSYANH
ncbi:MAG: DMT family transporter [Chloroflexi bacterium]|nr:DMT family transporter [Chloroflexota bacterium]